MSLSVKIRRTRILVTGAAAASLAALAIAGPAQAATAAPSRTAGSTVSVQQARALAPTEIVNLGVTVREGQAIQCFVAARYGYTGEVNGQLDTDSWKAIQRELTVFTPHVGTPGVYSGPIDGIVDSETITALQQMLTAITGYRGPIDGIVNPDLEAAFARYGDALIEDSGC
jgi:hypothetical protein